MPNSISHRQRTLRLREPAPSNRTPAKGMKAAKNCGAIFISSAFRKDAELDGTATASANGTALAPGVIVGGVKVHVAPAGNELCRHDRVMGWLGLPVLAFKESE